MYGKIEGKEKGIINYLTERRHSMVDVIIWYLLATFFTYLMNGV